ncbi:MAG: hypothetical protein LKG48_10315 [Lachnospiraceae bacterium]|nr:hypothetical protein [Lachnospiraceae bacterium]MCH4063682.1 hypothetical protein [Lachnospiraceae bacterium]MCH4103595.1 hypothetical protein [Lachnospiraceae bacterium]MCI1310137.1 hypothetical protein [Lachnospiraceae bacterium]MCI1334591.1 hypothetical protein [Lachnospiraceae bacterium]
MSIICRRTRGALIGEEQESCHDMNRRLMNGFSDEEKETLRRLLSRVGQNLDEELRKTAEEGD